MDLWAELEIKIRSKSSFLRSQNFTETNKWWMNTCISSNKHMWLRKSNRCSSQKMRQPQLRILSHQLIKEWVVSLFCLISCRPSSQTMSNLWHLNTLQSVNTALTCSCKKMQYRHLKYQKDLERQLAPTRENKARKTVLVTSLQTIFYNMFASWSIQALVGLQSKQVAFWNQWWWPKSRVLENLIAWSLAIDLQITIN